MKENRKNSTELVFILDGSGSMDPLQMDTIGGFNSLIKKQKDVDGECFVSTVIFNNYSKVVHDRVRLDTVREMTKKDYEPCGCTALLDAMGGAMKHIGNIHKYIRREDVPQKTMFIIITDGMENASTKFTKSDVREMVEMYRKNYDWEFMFIGANMDAISEGQSFGIPDEMISNYNCDSVGTKQMFTSMNMVLDDIRSNEKVRENWNEQINRDYNERKNNR